MQSFGGNARELMRSVEQEEMARAAVNSVDYLQNYAPQQFDVAGMVSDSLKHFYNAHETIGYKSCECTSCQQLQYPILIKSNRSSEEYEVLHRSYLQMVQYQVPMMAPPGDPEGSQADNKIMNVRLFFF